MHVVVVNEGFQLKNLSLSPGEFLVEDINAAEMLSLDLCRVKEPDISIKPFSADTDWNNRTIIFVRPGGFGDLLFLTPTFAEIKRRWPDAEIRVACFPQYRAILENNPHVAFEDYPIRVDTFKDYDVQIWLENIIEKNPEAKNTHAVDLLSRKVGIELLDKRMQYFPTQEELSSALEKFPRNAKKRIGVQVMASSPVRSYPPRLIVKMCREFMKRDWEVFLFGSPGQVASDSGPNLVNLTQLDPPVSFRESVAILKSCDAAVVPDSALCHVAGALDIPAVALYGPFPWQIRTAYAKSIFAINGQASCAPCFHHSTPLQVFPKGSPCEHAGECVALGQIDPLRIVQKVEQMI